MPQGGGGADGGADSGTDAGADGGVDAGGPVVLHPTNILNNGGFEYGGQCFGNWVWSSAGDYKGDYVFDLSTDAHSGSYSFEIRCGGADCLKAAIRSEVIPAPANEAYHLSLWSKCPSGGSGYLYLPSTATGAMFRNFTCNGSWAQTDLAFNSPTDGSGIALALYNSSTQPLQLDDVVLTLGDGGVPEQTVQHPGWRDVQVSGQRLLVDGAPYLALGFFNVPYEDLEAAKADGANTVVGLGDNPGHCFNLARPLYADRAYDLGLAVTPESSLSARTRQSDPFGPTLSRFGPHRANIAWFLADEPDQATVSWIYVPPADFIAQYQAAKAQTPLPLFADFQRAAWSPTEVAPYTPSVDMWMAEPYGEGFTNVTTAIDAFNGYARRPIWLAQDVVSAPLVVPKAYWVIAQGATGLIYFTWSAARADATQEAAVKQAFTELSSLKDVILGTPAESEVSTSSAVKFIARRANGFLHVIAATGTTSTVNATFSVQGLAAGHTVRVLFEDRTLTSTSGGFTDTFVGQARHVYRIE